MELKREHLGQKIYADTAEQSKYADWKTVDAKKKEVSFKGLNFKVIEKKEHKLKLFSLKRIGNICLGVFCTVSTLGLALFSKTIRQCLSGREVVRILKEDYDKEYVDKILKYLPTPSLDSKGKAPDDELYKLSAHDFLLNYINDPNLRDSLQIDPKKILELYERLSLMSKEDGSWVDGIDLELLPQPENILEEEDHLIEDLRKKILTNVLLKNDKEIDTDAEEEWINPEQRIKPDAAGEHYRFVPIQNQTPPNANILFQIVADEFGASSELEGSQSKLMVANLLNYMQSANQAGAVYSDKLINELKNAVDLSSSGTTSKAVIAQSKNQIKEAINQNKPTLIMGGWVGAPFGHAIYYEVIPAGNGEVNFRLYNTGAGIKHHMSVRDGDAIKYQPYCEWKGIKEENILSDGFLKAVNEMTTNAKFSNGNPTNYGEEDVYVGLKKILNPSSESHAEDFNVKSDMLMSPQRSGVCSSRSLLAWARSNMSAAEYKRFKSDYKLQMLSDFVKSQADKPHIEPKDWRLIQKAHQSISRGIVKLYEQKLVGNDYIESVLGPLQETRDWIKANKSCIVVQHAHNIDFQYVKSSSDTSFNNVHSLNLPLHELAKTEAGINLDGTSFVVEAFRGLKVNNEALIAEELTKASAIAKNAWHTREDIALHAGLVDLVRKIPLEADFWQKAAKNDPKKAEALISELGVLSSYFMKSCFTVPQAETINPEKIYVMNKMIYLQHLICRQGHPNSPWNEVEMPDPIVDKACKFPDKKMKQEMALIKKAADSHVTKYVNQGGKQVALNPLRFFDSRVVTGNPESTGVRFGMETESHKVDNPVEDIIRKQYPEVVASLQNSDPQFTSLPKKCQDARIFTSDNLPDWIKAMRDTSMCYQHMAKAGVGPLKELDRDADITPTYKFQDEINESKSTVFISLKGVNEDIYDNPVAKRVREEKLAFLGNYTDEPSPFLKAFYNLSLYSSDHKEGALTQATLADRMKDFEKFGNDPEFKEMLRWFSTGPLGQLEALEYFTNHPEKLKERDYQVLLHMSIFGEHLESNLKVKGFEKTLSTFIEKNYQFLADENTLQPAVFLLKISSQLKSFCPAEPFFKGTMQQLQKLSETKGLEPEVKSIIFAETVRELGMKESLTEGEIRKLISCSIYLRENKIESKNQSDPDTLKKAAEAVIKHATSIKKALESGNPNQALLNGILKDLRPTAEAKVWHIQGAQDKFPSFTTDDEELQLHPLRSELQSKEGFNLIPQAIRNNPLFTLNFPGVERAQVHSGGVYSFQDANQNEIFVSMNGDALVIEKQMKHLTKGDEFYQLIPPSAILQESKEGNVESLLGSRTIAQDYALWQSMEPQEGGKCSVFALDQKTGALRYEIKAQKSDGSNTALKLGEVLELPGGLKLGKTSNLLTHFEDPSYIHEWYDAQGKLVKLELPRFQLEFNINSSKQLMCEEFPGFFLSPAKTIPKLGPNPHFIALENAEGACKVLLPRQNTQAPQTKEVLLARYELERDLERGNKSLQKYHVYDLNEQGALTQKSREANLHLAEVLATTQQYNKAVRLLNAVGDKLTPFTPAEKKSLENITHIEEVTGDKSGNAIAIRVLAHYLLFKNATFSHLEIAPGQLASLRGEYSLYLDHFNNLTAFKLSKDQEIFLLKALLEDQFEPAHYLRLKELDPVAAQDVKVSTSNNPPVKNSDPHADIDSCDLRAYYAKDYTFDQKLITRLSENIDIFFGHYYELARAGGAQEKKKIQDSIPFLLTADQGKYSGQAKILEAVLANPSAFKKIPDNSWDQKTNEKWIKEVRTAAKAHAKKMQQTVKPPPLLYKDITPDNFRLEKPKGAPAEVTVDYSSEAVGTSLGVWSSVFPCFLENKVTADPNQVDAYKKTIGAIQLADPVAQKEQARLLKDIDSLPAGTNFTFNSDEKHLQKARGFLGIYTEEKQAAEINLLTMRKIFDLVCLEDKENLTRLETDLIRMANEQSEIAEEKNLSAMMKFSGKDKVISLDELIVFYARGNPGALLARNPALTPETAGNIFQMVEAYLMTSTRDQQRTRAEDKWQKLEALGEYDSPMAQDLMNELASQYTAKRQYTPKDHPAYLAFEHYSNVLMRPAQVEKLDLFLKGGHDKLIMEMIMGSGKSKVLLPLLGLLRANGENISMLIVPQPLFESVSQDTQNILQSFGQALNTLHFDRDTKFSKASLQTILDSLERIQENKECLVMTSKSVQSLLLKFVEKGFEHFTSENRLKEFPEDLAIMGKIITLLEKSGYPMIDEADYILNVLHEVCFSSGQKGTPDRKEFEVISEIFSVVYQDPEIRSLARLDSNPTDSKGAIPLTEELYFSSVQNVLTDKVIERFKTMKFESSDLTNKLNGFISSMKDEDRKLLTDYLVRNKDNLKASQQFFNNLDPDLQDIFALAGEELSHLLPFTLCKVCDVKYGLDYDEKTNKVKSPIAIPFAAAKVPSSGSQFANTHITMNYTFQTYMKNGVTFDLVEEQVKTLQSQATREMISNKELTLNDTKAWQALSALKEGLNIPFKYSPDHIQELVDHINGNPDIKLEFVTNIILPQMEVFPSKISCNPQNLIAMFKDVSGFTGTLWNSLSMHHALKPEADPGIDSKTLMTLFNNSRMDVVEIKEGSSTSMLNSLQSMNIDYEMIADAGGYFKDKSNTEIAHLMKDLKGKDVVCYKGQQVITHKDGEIPLSESNLTAEDRLTFLDQSHTTGADVPQKRDAISLVTVGHNMLLRDLLQSVWRLRGLDKSQKVRFVISEEVSGIIRQTLNLKPTDPIHFDEILSFVIINQALQQGQDNYKALKQQLDLIPQTILLQVLLNEEIKPEAKLQAFVFLKEEWVKPTNLPARERYGKQPAMMDSQEVIKGDYQASIDKINMLFTKMPWLEEVGLSKAKYLGQAEEIVSHLKNNVPKELPSPAGDLDSDQTVEVEVKAETETQTELETEEASAKPSPEKQGFFRSTQGFTKYGTFQNFLKQPISPSDNQFEKNFYCKNQDSSCPSFSLKSYLESDPKLKGLSSAFEGIDITANILDWTYKGDKLEASHFNLFGNHSPSIHHLDIREGKITVMSAEEAQSKRSADEYYNLTLGFNDPSKQLTESERLKIVKIKFLNGESQYSPDETELLKKWLQSQGPKKMQDFYENYVLAGDNKKPKADAYRSGANSLKQLFSAA
ncbi:DUF3638 domain-containing protein [Estrella lausannensis]|uniref:ubiquitinyl hydrolase 1 n=1 Tax=Estrella lausannensis TaxID=483423 RepID=A0A0H5DND4_9BACT|nr:DUF3638 domain-containing protein [Estrella lausannensis]CRX37687.1 Conserved hypothetical protein [Estrella lausannensis]